MLGHYTGIHALVADSLDYSTDPPTPVSTAIHTDGNGDELVHYGRVTFVFREDGTSFDFSGTADVAGGTGRYANATGDYWIRGSGSVITRTGRYLYFGWVDLNDDDD